MKKDLYVVYSNYHKKYFGGLEFRFPSWTRSIQNCYWFLTKEKALKFIEDYKLEKTCEIKDCIATYPENSEATISLKKGE